MSQYVSHEAAAEALDSLDDYARMGTGVDAYGPRGMLERYIAQQKAATLRQPAARVDESELARELRQEARFHHGSNTADELAELLNRAATALEAALSAQPAPERQGAVAVGYIAQEDLTHLASWSPAERSKGFGAYEARVTSTPYGNMTIPIYLHPAAPVGVPDGIAQAAAFIQKKADDYAAENCSTEWDTGAAVYHYGQAGEDYHHTLIELAEEVAALTAAPSAPQGTQQGEG